MESMRNMLLDFEKSVQCAICLQSLMNPVTTRCDHNFCNLCITKAMSGKSHIPCPLCKKVIKCRSLKKSGLCSIIPFVHRVTNQLQEEADIPYTLSQTTRALPEQVGKAADGVFDLSQNHSVQEEPVFCNGDLALHDNVIVASEDNTVETNQQDSVRDFAKEQNVAQLKDGSPISMRTAFSNKKEKTGHEMKEYSEKSDDDAASTTNVDSFNIVTKMIVAADVHCSSLKEIETPAAVQSAVKPFSSAKPGKRIEEQSKSSSRTMDSHVQFKHINGNVTEDPYTFPISQNAYPAKKPIKNTFRKKSGKFPLKKRKSSSDCEKSVPKRLKRNPKSSSDAEVAKAAMQGMIAEVEKHSLAIEKVPEAIRKDTLSSKSATKTIAKPLKKTSANVKKRANAKRDKFQKENLHLAQRLLSDSTSSSSESGCEREKDLFPREHVRQQSVEDKVSNWLQTASPPALSDVGIQRLSPSPQKDKSEIISDDDIISHSQVSVERLPDRVVVLKRRKFLSPVKLDPKLRESVRNQLWSRDAAVFGSSKPQKTFLPKNRKDAKCILRTDENIRNDLKKVPSKKGRKAEKIVIIEKVVRKKRGGKETELESIFDVPGLSQGVSPFATPVDEVSETGTDVHENALAESSNDQHPGVAQEKGKDGVEELLSPSNEKGLDEKMPEVDDQLVDLPTFNLSQPEKGEGQHDLQNVVKELQSPRSENYEIQSDNTEFMLKNDQSVRMAIQVTETVNNDKDIGATSVKNSAQQNPELSSSPSKMPRHCLPPKKRRLRSNDKLPSLGESPSGFTVPKQSRLLKTLPSPDFSEPVSISNLQGNTSSSTGPDAVENTCRMVMENLGELTRVQEHTEGAKQITTSLPEASEGVLKDAWGTIQMSDENPSACETDDSVIPPSTLMANLDLPATPQKCDFRRIPPEIMESDFEGTASSTQNKEISQKDHASIVLEDAVTNTTIIRNAPLPDETEFYEVEKPVGRVFTRSCEPSVTESSDNEDAGSLRCLTNGWGGTKLRIFRSTGSDTDSNASGFSKKKKRGQKHAVKDRQDSFASNKHDSTSATCENADDVCANNDTAEFGRSMPDCSEIIPNSEKIPENNADCKSDSTVRKSSRHNKGRYASFGHETCPYPKNKKKTTTKPAASTTQIEIAQSVLLAKTSKEFVTEPKNIPEGNLILQHLKEAEIVDQYENAIKDKPLIKKVTETKTKSKLSKIHPPKILPVHYVRRMQTGKRTKNNKVASNSKAASEDDAFLTRSYDDENLNSSWPYKDEKTRETFFLNHSQPSGLPKHITEVSVKLIKLNNISVGNLTQNLQHNGIDSVIDSSPMLFDTPDVHGGDLERPEEIKNDRGRSISIDLTKPTDWNEISTVTETDIIQDDASIIPEDVICCSWNEEEKVGTVVASCHEDDCSVTSGQRGSLQSTPQKTRNHWQMEEEDTRGPEDKDTSLIVDPPVQVVISALKEVSCINRSGFEKLIPQSILLLSRAIDSCMQAVAAIEKEINNKNDNLNTENDISLSDLTPALPKLSVEREQQPKGNSVPISVPETSKKRRGRPPKVKRSIPPESRSGTEIKKDTADKKQQQPAMKKDPSPEEIPSTSGLKFKTRAMRKQDEAAERDANQTEKNVTKEDTLDEMQDYCNEIDEIALLGEADMETETYEVPDQAEQPLPVPNEEDKVEQSPLNGDLSASVEHAMAALQSGLNATDNEKSLNEELAENHSVQTELLEEMDTEDVIEATQESPKKADNPGTGDVVSANVDAWLKRLSDLNKRKGEIQKQKIGDKWAKSKPSSGSPCSATGDRNSPKKPGNGILDKTNKVISESLHGVPDDCVAKITPADTLSQKAVASPSATVQKRELLQPVSPSKAHPWVTPDQLPRLSVVMVRTPIKELQARLLSSSTSNSENTFKIGEPWNKLAAVNENPENSDGCTHGSQRNHLMIQEWLDTAQSDAMSPENDVFPLPEKLGFVTTGLQERDIKFVKMFGNLYNGQYYPTFDVNNVTHVVVSATPQRACDRTLKYLQGIAGKKWVVDLKWVIDSLTRGKKLPEIDYEVVGDNCMKELESEGYETPQGPMKSRISDPDYRHLAGFRCVCLPPFSLITTEQTSELLQMCGATVASHLGDLITSDTQSEQRLIIVDAESSNVPDYMAMGEQFGASVVSIEWVYESISRFEAQLLDDFKITGFTQDSDSGIEFHDNTL